MMSWIAQTYPKLNLLSYLFTLYTYLTEQTALWHCYYSNSRHNTVDTYFLCKASFSAQRKQKNFCGKGRYLKRTAQFQWEQKSYIYA